MGFSLNGFQKSLSAALGSKISPAKQEVKKESPKINFGSFGAPQSSANSTLSAAPPEVRDKPSLFQLVNPANPVTIRPLFARADQVETLPVGGLPLGLVHDAVARTIEAIPAIAARTIANFRAGSAALKGQAGYEDLERGNGQVNLPFDASRIGLSEKVGERKVVDTGTALQKRYIELEAEHPGRPSNIARAALVPITDALNAFAAEAALTSTARATLRATNYSPELEKALQQYGLKNSGLSADEFPTVFKNKFMRKAEALIEKGDQAGLQDLSEATYTIATHLTGKGIPQLNTLGKTLQDLARLGLQDSKYGFTLKNPLFAEVAPEVAPRGLPGTAEVSGQPSPVGLSTRMVRKVGGTDDAPESFYRSIYKKGEKNFEPIESKPVQIKENLDTAVTKQPDGKFAVIEGKTGMQLGEPAATEALAVQSAWEEVAALGDEGIEKAINQKISDGEVSPRYEYVPVKNPSADQGLSMVPQEIIDKLAPLKRLVQTEAKATEIPKELQPLALEAKKYKNAADFAEANQQTLYRGTTDKEIGNIPKEGLSVSLDPSVAQKYARSRGLGGFTDKQYISPAAKVISLEDVPNSVRGSEEGSDFAGKAAIWARDQGYDVLDMSKGNEAELRILNKDILISRDERKALLSDLYDRSQLSSPSAIAPSAAPSNPAAPTSPAAKTGTYAVPAEPQAYEALIDNLSKKSEGDYKLYTSPSEEERLVDSLTQIFADLKGSNIADSGFTAAQLEAARQAYAIANEVLIDHPGRALTKYLSKKTNLLPEILGEKADTEFGRNGQEILKKILDPEGTRNVTVEEANQAIADYRELKQQVGEIQSRFRSIRDEIRTIKQKNQFVDSAKSRLAARTLEDLKELQAIVKAGERAGLAKGSAKLAESEAKFQRMISRLKERRTKITALQQAYNLTDTQMKAIRGTADPRFMDDAEFERYLNDMQKKAKLEQEKNTEKSIIDNIITSKDLKNPDNLRQAMELPKVSEMKLADLQEYSNALSRYQQNDAFLGTRMIQTILNTDLGDVKTVREIRQKLAEQSGVPLSELEDVRGDWTDKFAYDAALAEKNPLYKYMVQEFTGKMVENEQIVMALEHKLDELAKAARKSARPTGIIARTKERLVPQDKKVFDWLERSDAEQGKWAKMTKMTPQEIEYAEFVKALYRKWRDVLVEKGTLKKWREAYVTHTTQSFFEHWKDDGFIKAIGNWWKDLTEERIDFEAVGDTGEVLGLEKFFKYSLPRYGNINPSKNVARIVMQYASSFYKKQALDAMIPKLEAYTFSLQRPQFKPGVPMDPTMVGIDGKLRKFVRQWVNNKKGRRTEYMISQGSKLDAGLKAFKLFISLKDLGLNIISNTAGMVGNTMSNFFGLSTKNFVQGATRSATKQGRQLMRKYPGVVGPPPYQRLISAANDVGDTFSAGMFYLMSEFAYRAKGQFFLGSLTPEEFKNGALSPRRQAEIKLEMGKFHPMEDMKSLVGSTSEGSILTMYKGWAVPLLYTASRNSKRVLGAFRAASGLKGKARVVKMEEARQLLKLTVGAFGAWLFWQTVFGDDDEKDNSPVAKLKRRIKQELASSLSALNPETWLTVRPYEFAKEISKAITLMATLERYETTTEAHNKGDLKGISALQTQLTPSAFRQFFGGDAPKPSMGGGSSSSATIPALRNLQRLKKRAAPANRSLKNLQRLKKRLRSVNL